LNRRDAEVAEGEKKGFWSGEEAARGDEERGLDQESLSDLCELCVSAVKIWSRGTWREMNRRDAEVEFLPSFSPIGPRQRAEITVVDRAS
jgi:hypothetical protein